jgi:hypothetical protein
MGPHRGVRAIALAGVATVTLALGVVAASADTLTVETFTGTAVADPSAWVAGGDGLTYADWPGKACLSAGSDTSQAPIPGCASPSTDPAGSGVLRVTTALGGNQGFALYQHALPTTGGLDITFNQAQWGHTQNTVGGDGLAFFIVDGSTTLTEPGGGGGNLGYSPGNLGGNGVANGLLGIGLDSFGNYSTALTVNPSNSGCAAGTGVGSGGPGFEPDRAVVRGPGNGQVGYCWLGSSDQLPELSGATRAESTKVVRIVVDPDTVPAPRKVTVYLDGVQTVQVDAPPELLAATTFKFGFSGSIGAANDNHEFWDLDIESVNPITPVTPVTPAQPVAVTPAFTG